MEEKNNSQLLSRYLSEIFSPAFHVKNGVPMDPHFLDSRQDHVDTWPLPHERLRSLHQPALVQRYWDRVMQALREPVETKKINGDSRISQVLGSVLFVHLKDGRMLTYMWEPSDRNFTAHKILSKDVCVTEIPYGFIWLNRLCEQAKAHRQALLEIQGKEVNKEDLSDYTNWMFSVFKSRIKSHCDLRALRHKVRTKLGLNPDAWRITHRCGTAWYQPGKASVETYNLVVSNLDEFRRVEQDCKKTLPVYLHLRPAIRSKYLIEDVTQAPVKALIGYIKGLGFEPRVWRLVLQSAGRIVHIANNFYRSSSSFAVIDVLQILYELNLKRTPSRLVCQAIWGLYANRHNQRHWLFSTIEPCLPNLSHMIRLVDSQAHPVDEGELSQVVYYLTEPDTKPLDRRQRSLGWDYLVRQAQSLRKRLDQAMQAELVTWRPAFDPEVHRGLHYRCLKSSLELQEVGRAMRNCLGSMTETYSPGDLQAVYVTTPEGKPVAVAQLWFTHPGWRLDYALGPMNRTLSIDVLDKIRAFVRTMSDMDIAASKLRLGPASGRIQRYQSLYGNTAHIPFNHFTRMVMDLPISSDENFSRSVSISEFGALAPQFSVEFFSYLSTAKEPERSQKNFGMILTRDELENLREAIDRAIAFSDERSSLKALAQAKRQAESQVE